MAGRGRADEMPTDLPLMDALAQVSFRVMAILTQVGARHDLSLTHVRLLAILRDREPRMSDLADHLGLDRSTVSGLIDRAEERGLVRRIVDQEDRRSWRVGLTAKGRSLAAKGSREIASHIDMLSEELSAGQRAELARLLARLLR